MSLTLSLINHIETPVGRSVIDKIIPAAVFLGQRLLLRFDTLLSPNLCAEYGMKDDTLLCYKIDESDNIFKSLKLK